MSTKLYDGLRLTEPDLFVAVPVIATAIKNAFHELRPKIVAEEVAAIVDTKEGRNTQDESNFVFLQAHKNWLKEQAEYGPHHRFNDPLRFEICFGQAVSRSTLAYPFHNEPAYQATLLETGLFQEYGYQNNADKPDDITEQDWTTRRLDWNSILNAEGNMTSLPTWRLAGSIDDVFDIFAGYDLNEYLSRHTRLLRILTAAAVNSVYQSAAKQNVQMAIHEVISASQTVTTAVNEHLAELSPTELETLLPQPLPPVDASLEDLAPTMVPDVELVKAILDRAEL